MKIKNFLLLAFLVVSVQLAKAQEIQPLDGAYIEERALTRKFLPYAPIREADVLFKKRVWRILDMREKMNLPLYYPPEPANGLKSLASTIFEALEYGLEVFHIVNEPLLESLDYLFWPTIKISNFNDNIFIYRTKYKKKLINY